MKMWKGKWGGLRDWLEVGAEYDKLSPDQRKAYEFALKKMEEYDEIENRIESRNP